MSTNTIISRSSAAPYSPRDGDNRELTVERRNVPFDQSALAAFFWGSRERVQRRREIVQYIERCGAELRPAKNIAFMTRAERLESVARLSVAMLQHAPHAVDVSSQEELFFFNYMVGGFDGSPYHLHFIMAIPAMMNNGDDEQRSEWLPQLLNGELIATYAQTELGHGTNLSRLETTATYDPTNEEFVLNSPTITATKWWPGNLGKSANFAVVVANLWTRGLCHGPHLFWVQLRDRDTRLPLRGISIGDIGPKFGINSNDNGFLRLDSVRIPRRQMLMRHARVLLDGTYQPPLHPKVNSSTMMYIRSAMIRDQAMFLAMAVTVAIRYSAVRRQGEMVEGKGEVKILDYRTQQYRLFPQLARAYAMFMTGSEIVNLYRALMEAVNADGDSSLIQDTHALSSGLKAVCSYQTAQGIEQCRMACGGHGYSEASGLPLIYTAAVGGCTYEGENLVMLLQGAKYLMKCARQIRYPHQSVQNQKKKRSPVIAYLFERGESILGKPLSLNDHSSMVAAFHRIARHRVLKAFDRLDQLQREMRPEEAWNEASVDLARATRAHTRAFLARAFVDAVGKVPMTENGVRHVLDTLVDLYLTYELVDCSAALLEVGYTVSHVDQLNDLLLRSLKRLRPIAVAIVDSFEFSDHQLNSVLGRRDGNVYENLLKWAKEQPLNQTEVLPFHEKYLGRAMKEARMKAKNGESKI